MPEQDYLDQKAKYGIQEWGAPIRVVDGECFCGTCSPCRRAMRAMDKEQGAVTHWIKSTGVPVMDAQPAAIGTAKNGNRSHIGRKRTKAEENERNKENKKRARAERYGQRIMQDGYLFHPDPKVNHGTMYAYDVWGCKCDACYEGKYGKPRERKMNA